MLKIVIPERELYDEEKEEFIYVKEQKLQLEHSLVSLAKWESKWEKPFLSNKDLSTLETIDYIRCMTITQNVNPNIYNWIPDDIINEIQEYISSDMTATTINEVQTGLGKSSNEIVTAEIIYYWMFTFRIPMECQKWHLNRLITLIRVFSIKNSPQKKRNRKDIRAQNKILNEQRKKKYNTKG